MFCSAGTYRMNTSQDNVEHATYMLYLEQGWYQKRNSEEG